MDIDKISILQVSLNELSINSPMMFDPALARSFAFDVQHSAEFDTKEGLVMTVTSLQAATISDDGQEEEGDTAATFSVLFRVDDLEDHTAPGTDGAPTGSHELKIVLASLSLSTVRGLMSGYLNKSVLEDFLLPVIDPEALAEY